MSDTAFWTGASGKQYRYYVFKLPFDFEEAFGGNYILCFLDEAKQWRPVQIGQTGNFAEHFEGRDTRAALLSRCATHVHAHLSTSVCSRLAEEDDLVENYAAASPAAALAHP